MNSAFASRSAPRIELRTSSCTPDRRAALIALRCQDSASGCGLDSRNTLSTPPIAATSDPSSARSPATVSAPAGIPPAGSPGRTSARTCCPRSSRSLISALPILLRPPMININAVPFCGSWSPCSYPANAGPSRLAFDRRERAGSQRPLRQDQREHERGRDQRDQVEVDGRERLRERGLDRELERRRQLAERLRGDRRDGRTSARGGRCRQARREPFLEAVNEQRAD